MPREQCPYHVEYWRDNDTGYRLNPLCRAGRDAEPQVFTVLPASVRRWISDRNLQTQEPPPRLPSCQHVASGAGPRIIVPRDEAVYFMVPGIKATNQEIPLEAEAGADVGELFWFVDGKFLSSKTSGERVWLEPEPGSHEIRVLDASGRSHTIQINVMTPG